MRKVKVSTSAALVKLRNAWAGTVRLLLQAGEGAVS